MTIQKIAYLDASGNPANFTAGSGVALYDVVVDAAGTGDYTSLVSSDMLFASEPTVVGGDIYDVDDNGKSRLRVSSSESGMMAEENIVK